MLKIYNSSSLVSIDKNLIQYQKRNSFRINQSEKLNIDSKKEFNVSVNACLFLTHFNTEPDFICHVRNLGFAKQSSQCNDFQVGEPNR